jgi:hypothetical protein
METVLDNWTITIFLPAVLLTLLVLVLIIRRTGGR